MPSYDTVVYDPGGHEPATPDEYPEYWSFWERFRAAIRSTGLEIVRAGTETERHIDARRTLLVSHGWSSHGARLIANGATPAVLLSFESPVIDYLFYWRLPTLSQRFRFVFVYGGALARVARTTTATPLFPPLLSRVPRYDTPQWSERAYLTSVLGNKFSRPVSLWQLCLAALNRYLPGPLDRKESVRRQLVCLTDPSFRRTLYDERIRILLHFSRADDFVLYGRGWRGDNPYSIPQRYLPRILSRYGGVADGDATDVLARFRFALCIDNTTYPGYFSERIYRCFRAGCIPVYLGAPDIDRFIPRDAYVDMREFSSYGELDRFLRAMCPAEAERCRAAARSFLASPAADRFDHQRLAERVAAPLASIADTGR